MKPTIKQTLAGIGVVLAVLSFWTTVPLAVPVLFIGAAVLFD